MERVPVSVNPNKSPLVTQSNQLTEARYSLTVAEQRFVLTMLSFISPDDGDFKEYEIRVLDFKKILNINTNTLYDQLRDTLKKLASRVIYIPKGKKGKDYLITNWFSSAEYCSDSNSIKISFDKKLKPYLLQLKEQFTKYRLFVVAQFKSSYTIRIYMLLKQYECIGSREIGLEELKEMLAVDAKSYDTFKRFRERVLNQAKKEFETKNKEAGGYISDITFDLETIRTGREITRLRFHIRKQAYQEPLPLDIQEEEVKEKAPALEALEKYGIRGAMGEKYLKEQGEEAIYRCIELFEEQKRGGTVKKEGVGLLIALLERGAGRKTEAEKVEEEKIKKKEELKKELARKKQEKEEKERLGEEFSKAEHEKFLALPEEEKREILEIVKKENSIFKTMKDIEKRSFWSFAQKQIQGFSERKEKYIQENLSEI